MPTGFNFAFSDSITINVGAGGAVSQTSLYNAILSNDVHVSVNPQYGFDALEGTDLFISNSDSVASVIDGVSVNLAETVYHFSLHKGTRDVLAGPFEKTIDALISGSSATLRSLAAGQTKDVTLNYYFIDSVAENESGPGSDQFSNDFVSNTSSITFHFIGVNDAPVLGHSATALTATENSGVPTGAVGNLVSSIVGSNVVDYDTGAVSGIAITNADSSHGTWYFSTDNGAHWSTLGSVGEANSRLLAADGLTRLYFKPDAGFSGPVNSAITYHAWDQTSGQIGGTADLTATGATGGTTAFSSATDTISLSLNGAPDVIGGNAVSLSTIDEGANPAGTTVQDLFASHFSSAAGNQFAGIAIVGNPAGADQGSWQYFSNGTWHDVGAVSTSSALILDPTTLLRFVPAGEFLGNAPNLSLRLVDSSHPITSGASVDLTSSGTGGATPYSTETLTLGETVRDLISPAASATITDVDSPHTFALTDFQFTSSSREQIASVVIDALPTRGTLQLMVPHTQIVVVTANTIIQAADIGYLVYTPSGAFQGTDTFSFRLLDDAVTGQTAIDASSAATMTITVKPNDAPVAVASTAVTDIGQAHTFAATDFHFTDVADAPGPLKAVIIDSLPTEGTLKLMLPGTNGVTVNAHTTIQAADLSIWSTRRTIPSTAMTSFNSAFRITAEP